MEKLITYLFVTLLFFQVSGHSQNCENVFSKLFGPNQNLTLDASFSGPGSDLEQTKVIRREIPKLLKTLNCKTMIDAPCGDFFWMQHMNFEGQYIGCDVISDLIDINEEKYANKTRRFLHLDFTRDSIPKGDIILCRDCLVHLSYNDLFKVLCQFKKSGAQYLLTTTFPSRANNYDIRTGDWRPLNLQIAPFNFPKPLYIINENCSESGGQFKDKSLALWRIADLPNLPNCRTEISTKMSLNRVILAVDSNPNYLMFWPYAAKAWSKIVGVRPTLALIASEDVQVDESLGDVIRFEPLDNIPTSCQAQIIRLLLPAHFPEDVCIISDIDQIPADRNYFHKAVEPYDSDSFVVYKDFLSHHAPNEFPMCYNAAKGKTFGEVFNVSSSLEAIRQRLNELAETEFPIHDWYTDQRVLFKNLTAWHRLTNKGVFLGEDWIYKKLFMYDYPISDASLRKGTYHDVQLERVKDSAYNKAIFSALGIN